MKPTGVCLIRNPLPPLADYREKNVPAVKGGTGRATTQRGRKEAAHSNLGQQLNKLTREIFPLFFSFLAIIIPLFERTSCLSGVSSCRVLLNFLNFCPLPPPPSLSPERERRSRSIVVSSLPSFSGIKPGRSKPREGEKKLKLRSRHCHFRSQVSRRE